MKLGIGLVAIAAAAGGARADTDSEAHGDEPQVRSFLLEGGASYRVGADDQVVELDAFTGITGEPRAASWRGGRLYAALGVRVGYGGVASEHELPQPSPADPTVIVMEPAGSIRTRVGPELRLGLAWPRGRWPVRLSAGGGTFWSKTSAEPEAAPWIPEMGYRRGARASLGVVVRHVLLELSWEHVAGVDRAGVTLGAAL